MEIIHNYFGIHDKTHFHYSNNKHDKSEWSPGLYIEILRLFLKRRIYNTHPHTGFSIESSQAKNKGNAVWWAMIIMDH